MMYMDEAYDRLDELEREIETVDLRVLYDDLHRVVESKMGDRAVVLGMEHPAHPLSSILRGAIPDLMEVRRGAVAAARKLLDG